MVKLNDQQRSTEKGGGSKLGGKEFGTNEDRLTQKPPSGILTTSSRTSSKKVSWAHHEAAFNQNISYKTSESILKDVKKSSRVEENKGRFRYRSSLLVHVYIHQVLVHV